MARARNIKPAFFLNDDLSEIDPLGRLLFIGMWTIADHSGNFEWREKRVKMQILPYDTCDVKELAINLDKSGFIRFYSDQEKTYCHIVNFSKHQNPHKNEKMKGSEIPLYSDSMRQAVDLKGFTINHDKSGLKPEYSTSDPADSLNLIPDSLNPITPLSSPTVPTSKKHKYSDDDRVFAEGMISLIRKKLPEFKQPDIDSWSNTIRLMREIDNRTHKSMADVFRWCQSDSFWCSNILSPKKLRDKFDQLSLKMKEPGGGSSGVGSSKSSRGRSALDNLNNRDWAGK